MLLARCHEAAGSSGRFHAYMQEPLQSMQLCPQTGAVTGISTASRRWVCRGCCCRCPGLHVDVDVRTLAADQSVTDIGSCEQSNVCEVYMVYARLALVQQNPSRACPQYVVHSLSLHGFSHCLMTGRTTASATSESPIKAVIRQAI